MNRLLFCFAFFLVCLNVSSQVNYDSFVGTWVYQKNDTVFKIRLQKGVKNTGSKVLFGGYFLSIGKTVTDNYIGIMPSLWDINISAPACNIYIIALNCDAPNCLGVKFYDQRKKHFDGEGIGGGWIELIAPNKIHWTLNEREGLWPWLEGEQIEGRELPTIEEAIRGFSVPTDVIMIKEE